MIQNSRYFFYGSPATYALVGLEDQHVWLVTDNLAYAQFISQAFRSKITLGIFDLTTFENYTPSLIDNTVCFDWQVPVNVLSNTSVLDKPDSKIDFVVHTGSNTQLKNIVEHDILLLSADRCCELQQQLMCIHTVCRSFDPTNLIISDQIKQIVAVNLELPEIELALYDLANTLTMHHPYVCYDILAIINRLYA